ncbi:MAG: hypothetical protein LBP33_07515 [Candidatus Adiutrix sp.]|jgi:hypothetical protein|nr:hypothetical protein [Candidatus Adiutrix sp.]
MEHKLTDSKIRSLKPAEDGPQVKRYTDGHGKFFWPSSGWGLMKPPKGAGSM